MTKSRSRGTLRALLLIPIVAGFLAPNQGYGSEDLSPLLDPDTVELITPAQFEAVLAHHRGDVILVNLWATWCIPCIQELPELEELQTRYRDKGFRILAVSLDEPEDLDERVRPFFTKRAPELVSYLKTGTDEEFVAVLDPEWPGALPTSFVIDREGEVRKSMIGRKTFAEFERAIRPLL